MEYYLHCALLRKNSNILTGSYQINSASNINYGDTHGALILYR